MDQRKLMDNANTITDMAKTQNTVYEIVSDMSTRQDTIDERLSSLEDKFQTLQVQTIFNSKFGGKKTNREKI